MKRILYLTGLLLAGLVASQVLPLWFGVLPEWFGTGRHFFTMAFLSYIMIEVGREFDLGGRRVREFGWDYVVAATAAGFPWIFCAVYFYIFLYPEEVSSGHSPLVEILLASRFAAPTSAGVLFTMLAAAGLAHTWTFQKTRILAIFDDLDTVLLMIPLKMLIVGLAWQLGGIMALVVILLLLGWKFYRKLNIPTTWGYTLLYSLAITLVFEVLYYSTRDPQTNVGLQVEVLLPAFLLGCMMRTHEGEHVVVPGEDPPGFDAEEAAGFVISCLFLFLVGLSMPAAVGDNPAIKIDMSIGELVAHVIAVTVLANLGKMFVVFCYRKEATLRQRLAVAVAMFPRGEVGAGVLAVSLSYGISGAFVTVAFLSLALNLVLTGAFIIVVKALLKGEDERSSDTPSEQVSAPAR